MAAFSMLWPEAPGKAQCFMPYALGIKIPSGSGLLVLAGQTAEPLYHSHPHIPEELDIPSDIESQTRRTLDNVGLLLEHAGCSFADVIRADIFVTDMTEQDRIGMVMRDYFGDHVATGVMVEVKRLVVESLRIEIQVTAVLPAP